MAKEPSEVRKSVFAIHIRPVNGSLSLKARKLQISLARLAGEQYRKLTEAQREEIENAARSHVKSLREGARPSAPPILLQPRFQARIQEVAEAVGHDVGDARHIMDDLKRLQAVQVEFNTLEHRAAEAERDMYPEELSVVTTLLSSAMKTGRGWVSWAYDPLILSIMVNPRTYAQLNLSLVRNARTYTALALYENVKRFIHTGRAGPYSIKRWQELLSDNGVIPSWEDSAELKRKVRRALAELELNENCDIDIKMSDCRMPLTGEAALEFSVKMRPQQNLGFGEPVPENKALFEELTKIGFSPAEARGIVDVNDEEKLFSNLALLKKAKNVLNAKGWFIAALKNDYDKTQTAAALTPEQVSKKQKTSSTMEQLSHEFQALRSTRVRDRFADLEPEYKNELIAQFDASEAGASIKQSKLVSKAAKEGAFFGWLIEQQGQLKEDEERDFAYFLVWKTTQ